MQTRCLLLITAVAVLWLFTPTSAKCADEWGDLSGRFVWQGERPQVPLIEYGLGKGMPDRSLLVNAKDQGIANVAVFLWPLTRGDDLPLHPTLVGPRTSPLVVEILDGQLLPRVGILHTSQSLVLHNKDQVAYNPNIASMRNPGWNALLEPGKKQAIRFQRAERIPVQISDNIRSHYFGYLVIADHPYVAVSDDSGRFTIKNCPTGRWTFRAWHERTGWVRSVQSGGEPREWERGTFDAEITGGSCDLGDVQISRDLFRLD